MSQGYPPPPPPPLPPQRNQGGPPPYQPPGPPVTEDQLRWKFAGGWGTVVLVVIMGAIGVLLAGLLASELWTDHRYASAGVTADGTIVGYRYSVSTGRRNRRSTTYYLQYRFTDRAGRVHVDDESVSPDLYARFAGGRPDAQSSTFLPLRTSARHPVEHVADDPNENRLLRPRSSGGKWAMAGFATALLGGAAAIRHFGRKRARRRARVLFHGTPVPGQVLVSETRGAGKNRRHVLQYRYIGLDGTERTSKPRNVTAEQLGRFPVGHIITVTIDPADPARPEPDLYGCGRRSAM